jgi:hypothetical protein
MRTFPWQALQRRLAQDRRPEAAQYPVARARSQPHWTLCAPAAASWYDRTRRLDAPGTWPALFRDGDER